ncbi:MAG: prepilin-type N-terminal cleavage/methylation domain-containing protein [Kiritimatiellae bacterium]|nr:prepilin-type N-terminal cleavage/methylation domain-containing protein [Kiritimatiellia bacterium]
MNRRHRAGFSLIEVLSAMAILSIIVLMAARLFNDSVQMWKIGSRRVEQDINARASLELIGRQLTMAMVDPVLQMRVANGAQDLYGNLSHTVTFASFDHRAENKWFQSLNASRPYRDIQQTRYALFRPATNPPIGFLLLRVVTEDESWTTFRAYSDPAWAETFTVGITNVMAEHVARFNIYTYLPGPGGQPVRRDSYDSRYDPPPLWFDIVLYLLDEDDAIKAANLTGGTRNNFLDRNVRRYVHRAYPHNVPGMNILGRPTP